MRIPATLLAATLLSCAHSPPPPATAEARAAPPAEDPAAAAADRERQERENREVLAWKEAQKGAEAEGTRAAEQSRIQVTRLDELAREKAETEARARAEREQRDLAAAEAKAKVERARASTAPVGGDDQQRPATQRRPDRRLLRPGLSGQLCALRAAGDATARAQRAEEKRVRAGRGDRARLEALRAEAGRIAGEARQARSRLRQLGVSALPCSDRSTAAVARCYRSAAAEKRCPDGPRQRVEAVRALGSGG